MLNQLFIVITTMSFVSYLYLGFYVLFLDPHSNLNRNFLYICLSFALWSLGYIFFNINLGSQSQVFWGKIEHLGATIYAPFILKFILILTSYYNKIRYKFIFNFIIWIFPAILVYKNLVDNAIISDFPYGWYLIKQFLNVYNFCSIAIILTWGFKSKTKREKKQAITIVVGAVITIAFSAWSDFFMEIHGLNTMASSIILIWIISVWYAIVKYRLLSITPEFVSNKILSSIDEVIILLNKNGEVITANDKTKKIFGNKIIRERLIKDIRNYTMIENKFNDLLRGKLKEFFERLHIITKENKKMLIDVDFTLVKDKFDDIIGVLLVGKEVKGVEHLKNVFKLTDREIDIILHIISGSTNEIISNKLGITINTMKRHITNIYNKLSIFNKVELMTVAKNFNLIPYKN